MICDAHCHFFSARFLELLTAVYPGLPEGGDALRRSRPGSGGSRRARPTALADRWIAELDRHGVSRATLMASIPGDEASVVDAVARHPARLRRELHVQPGRRRRPRPGCRRCSTIADASHRRAVPRDARLPPRRSARSTPCSTAAEAAGAAVFVHCGVLTVGVRAKLGLPSPFDLRLGDPLAVAAVAARHPSVPVIIPHFGAGFFREALMAADAVPEHPPRHVELEQLDRVPSRPDARSGVPAGAGGRRAGPAALRHRLVVLPARLAEARSRRAGRGARRRQRHARRAQRASWAAISPGCSRRPDRRAHAVHQRPEDHQSSWSAHTDSVDIGGARRAAAMVACLAARCRLLLDRGKPGTSASRPRRHQRPHRHGRGRAGRRRRRWRSAAIGSSRSVRTPTSSGYVGPSDAGHRRQGSAGHPRVHREPRPLHRRRRGAAEPEPDERHLVGSRSSRWSPTPPRRRSRASGFADAAGTRRNGQPRRPRTSKGFPTHASLDRVSPDNPVVLTHASGHASFVNAKAMEVSGITRSTASPAGGEILKDATGDPTGLLREKAADLVKVGAGERFTPEERLCARPQGAGARGSRSAVQGRHHLPGRRVVRSRLSI